MRDFDFCDIEFEETDCLFCKDKTEKEVLFRVPDRVNRLPGRFNLVRCKNCGLVFQDPRPKEEYIKYYYPDEAGYFQPTRKKQNKYLQWIGKNIRINFYNYENLGKKNLILKVLLFPLYFYFFKHQTIPHYVKNGRLLEIGCSHGEKLKKLKNCGWEVIGIEPNEKAAKYGMENRELDIKIGSILALVTLILGAYYFGVTGIILSRIVNATSVSFFGFLTIKRTISNSMEILR